MAVIAAAVADLLVADVPILFVDTCVLIDIIRAPSRPESLSGCVKAAAELHRAATAVPIECRLVTASFVRSEWAVNSVREQEMLQTHLARLELHSAAFHQCCGHVGIGSFTNSPAYVSAGLEAKLRELSKQLLNNSVQLEPDRDLKDRADARIRSGTAPATKGGEYQDCVILEECLEVASRLRRQGFARRMVFSSSNTKHYCSKKRLHPDLIGDFSASSIVFKSDLEWAVFHLLR